MSFTIGKIVNTQGVKGEMRVVPQTDDPQRFELLKEVALRHKGRETRYALETLRYHKQFVLIKLAGVDDMTAAEKLRGAELVIADSEALPLSEGEFYARDLYGLAVVSDEGEALGELSDILNTGANDVYVVSKAGEKDLLIPALKSCILSVDLAAKVMTVHLLEGLR